MAMLSEERLEIMLQCVRASLETYQPRSLEALAEIEGHIRALSQAPKPTPDPQAAAVDFATLVLTTARVLRKCVDWQSNRTNELAAELDAALAPFEDTPPSREGRALSALLARYRPADAIPRRQA